MSMEQAQASRRFRWVAGYEAALEQPATTMGGIGMIKRRRLLSIVASASLLVAGGVAMAKNQHHNNVIISSERSSVKTASMKLPRLATIP
jgi:hypothetical protein